jgi:hypothetical protein
MAIVKLRLHAAINRVRFVFWRIKMCAGAIICRFALSYNITGGGAPIFRQSKKCRQKHDGFSRLLTPSGSFWQCYLPLTNRDPLLLTVSFTPLDFR